MMERRPAPPIWFCTAQEAAANLGVDRDHVLFWADIGELVPAVRIPSALVSIPQLAPAPYVLVYLHGYVDMRWINDGAGDLIAPLAGSHRVYQVDGLRSVEAEFDGTILVRRSELLFLTDGIAAFREEVQLGQTVDETQKRPNPTKLRTLQRIAALLIADRWPDAGNYTVAGEIVRGFQLLGLTVSKECAASHVKECRRELDAAPNADEGCRANSDELAQAA
jgi:hypothetical protein